MSKIAKTNQPSKDSFDSLAKVAIVGDSSVGKTNILLRYIYSEYQQSHVATIGIDFKVKMIDIDGFRLKMQIWDTAGQERFRNLTGTIYQGAQAIILVYSVANKKSFENIEVWMEDLANFSKKNVILALVGNKCDLESDRIISREEGQKAAQKYKISVFEETSAKEGLNIERLFQRVGKKIKDQVALSSEKKVQKKKEEVGKKIRSKSTMVENEKEKNPEKIKLDVNKSKKQKKDCQC